MTLSDLKALVESVKGALPLFTTPGKREPDGNRYTPAALWYGDGDLCAHIEPPVCATDDQAAAYLCAAANLLPALLAVAEAARSMLALPWRCETCALDGCAVDCDCPCHAERARAQAGLSAALAALDAKKETADGK